MKTYQGISLDVSASMRSLVSAAVQDYNALIGDIRTSAADEGIDTIVSVVKCGVGQQGTVEPFITNSNISVLKPITTREYSATGYSTPLFDSVGRLIEQLERVPDANDPEVAFVVMAVTDGQDNSSRVWKHKIGAKIRELQATDRWTFVFRVPRGYAGELVNLGIPMGNIHEWDQTERGVQESTSATSVAMKNFYAEMKTGKKSTTSFYTTNLTGVSAQKLTAKMVNISNSVVIWNVEDSDHGSQIRQFCETRLNGKPMKRGAAFYLLMKTENEVQDHKLICIRNKKTGTVFSGASARDLLGLPYQGTVKVVPGNHGAYDIFIQSTSVNRKLVKGTQVLYWENVGTNYKS